MTAGIILLLSAAALIEFFVAYCRSVISSTSGHILSDHARTLAEAKGNRVAPERFVPVMRLVKLCPQLPQGSEGVGAVSVYYSLMTAAAGIARQLRIAGGDWADGERASCAFFAAVALDRRIAFSREMRAEQVSNAI